MQASIANVAEIRGPQRPPGWRGWLLVAPMLLWLVAFVVVPTAILVVYSFGEQGEDAPVKLTFTTENYLRVVKGTDLQPLLRIGVIALAIAAGSAALRFLGRKWDLSNWRSLAMKIGWAALAIGLVAFVWDALRSVPAEDDSSSGRTFITYVAFAGFVLAALIAIRFAEGVAYHPENKLKAALAFAWQIFLVSVIALVCWNFEDIFSGIYVQIFIRSVGYAGLTTALCIAIGFPVAYYIGRAPENRRNLLLLLVMIPFWTSFLIRTYAWLNILAEEGLLNGLLLYSHILSSPLEILYTRNAVLIGLIYSYLPFMILPIYGSVEKLDNALIEAAFDLGAGPIRAFQKVIVPLTKPGIIAGALLVFVPAIGMFAITDLMGGKTTPMIGNVIQNQFGQARDWPFGSALGVSLLFLFAVALWFSTRKGDSSSVMG